MECIWKKYLILNFMRAVLRKKVRIFKKLIVAFRISHKTTLYNLVAN